MNTTAKSFVYAVSGAWSARRVHPREGHSERVRGGGKRAEAIARANRAGAPERQTGARLDAAGAQARRGRVCGGSACARVIDGLDRGNGAGKGRAVGGGITELSHF